MSDLAFRAKNFSKQKALGQNFLIDESKLDAIVKASNLDSNKDIVVEIGAGIGFLTERLVKHCKKLYAVELDASTETHHKILEANYPHYKYIRADFLGLTIPEIVGDKTSVVKVVANIPYQISSRIILHLLGEIGEPSISNPQVSEINILVQKEFADRLLAKPGIKDHGAMTLLLSYWATVEKSLDVPKGCFMPRPKVESSFVKITKRAEPLIKLENPKAVRRFIKAVYANRRKKLFNGLLAAGYPRESIEKLNLDENLRGECLDLEQINQLVKQLTANI